jgi:integrase
MEHHAKAKKESWRRDKIQVDKWLKPRLGKLLVRDVKRPHIARLHAEIGKVHQVNANRVLSLLSKMFNEATVWGFLDEDAPNPAKKIERFAETSRDRFLSKDDLPALGKAINNAPDEILKRLIWLYLLTGMRKSELMAIKWEDIDLEQGSIRLAKHKTSKKSGAAKHVPLSALAVRLLKSMPRFIDNSHVFPGLRKGDHKRDVRKAWDNIKEEAKIKDLTIHDLRRTVGSYMAEEGRSLALIGELLGHTSEKTTKIYARFGNQPLRNALEEHAKQLESVIDV